MEICICADWAGDQEDRKYTSGYCTFVFGNLLTWRSKKSKVWLAVPKQNEYPSIALGICEGMNMKSTSGSERV